MMADSHAYCTYFDSGYLSRGLALIESLRSHGDDSPVWVLALDDATRTYLDAANIPNVFTLTIAVRPSLKSSPVIVRSLFRAGAVAFA